MDDAPDPFVLWADRGGACPGCGSRFFQTVQLGKVVVSYSAERQDWGDWQAADVKQLTTLSATCGECEQHVWPPRDTQ